MTTDLANATQLAATSFNVTKVSPGSVIVDAEILPSTSGRGPDPQGVALNLEAQSQDPNSALRSGILTRYLTALTRGRKSPPPTIHAQAQPPGTFNPQQTNAPPPDPRLYLSPTMLNSQQASSARSPSIPTSSGIFSGPGLEAYMSRGYQSRGSTPVGKHSNAAAGSSMPL